MSNRQRIYIAINKRPVDDRPRERLWKSGADSLSNAELLAIMVRSGSTGRSALDIAEDILSSQEEGIHGLSKMHPRELLQINGVGEANGATVISALELARRLQHQPRPQGKVYLKTIEDVATHFRVEYGAGAPEKFVAFFINSRHRLLGELRVATGGANAVVVDAKRIFKEALLCGARAIILAHNHPGGSLEPSKHDRELTTKIEQAGDSISISLVEHVIVTADNEIGLFGDASSTEN